MFIAISEQLYFRVSEYFLRTISVATNPRGWGAAEL